MILQFTQRLHTTELERKDLLREKKHLVNCNNKTEKLLLKEKEHNSVLQTQEKKLKDKVKINVSNILFSYFNIIITKHRKNENPRLNVWKKKKGELR